MLTQEPAAVFKVMEVAPKREPVGTLFEGASDRNTNYEIK